MSGRADLLALLLRGLLSYLLGSLLLLGHGLAPFVLRVRVGVIRGPRNSAPERLLLIPVSAQPVKGVEKNFYKISLKVHLMHPFVLLQGELQITASARIHREFPSKSRALCRECTHDDHSVIPLFCC